MELSLPDPAGTPILGGLLPSRWGWDRPVARRTLHSACIVQQSVLSISARCTKIGCRLAPHCRHGPVSLTTVECGRMTEVINEPEIIQEPGASPDRSGISRRNVLRAGA